mgnify:CR=1 FL=1
MPYKTTWEARGILWEFYDDVSAQEIEDANNEFYVDERSDGAKYQIIDARNVKSVEWEERDIKVMAAYDIGASNVIRRLKVAYITSDEEITSKIEKYIDLSRQLSSNWEFQGFNDLNSARTWVSHGWGV